MSSSPPRLSYALRVAFAAALSLAAALLGCGPDAPLLRVGPAPWKDREAAAYDVVSPGGAVESTNARTFRRDGSGWTLTRTKPGKKDGSEVTMGADLAPTRTVLTRGDKRIEVDYRPTSIHTRTTGPDGDVQDKEIPRPEGTLDEEQFLEVLRAIPFAPGYEASAPDYVAKSAGALVNIRVRVVGTESITVPAGTFEAFHVTLRVGGVENDAWYGKDDPKLFLRYRNRGSGSEIVLRSWVPSEGAAPRGSREPPPEPPPHAGPPSIRWPVALATVLGQMPLMLVAPILLLLFFRRRFGAPEKLWGIGAAAFIASQIVHLPLNYALGLLGSPRGVALWPLPAYAAVVGLSAGLCEEMARFLFMRRFLRDHRSYTDALQFGAGHGGVESIIFGLLSLVSFANMVLAPVVAKQLTPAQAEQLYTAAAAYWRAPAYMPLLGGVERLGAMSFHVLASVLVMRAVARRAPGYLIAAIALHALTDAGAVALTKSISPVALEGILLAGGVAYAAITVALRERAPKPNP